VTRAAPADEEPFLVGSTRDRDQVLGGERRGRFGCADLGIDEPALAALTCVQRAPVRKRRLGEEPRLFARVVLPRGGRRVRGRARRRRVEQRRARDVAARLPRAAPRDVSDRGAPEDAYDEARRRTVAGARSHRAFIVAVSGSRFYVL